MVTREKLYTAEEFFELAQQPEHADKWWELVDGVIVEMPKSNIRHSVISARLAYLMGRYVYENDVGFMVGIGAGFKLSSHTMRSTDVAFISYERMPKIPEFLDGAPDIAVEVVSPYEDIFLKANEYLDASTSLVWAVYPDDERIHVLQKAEPRWQELGIEDTLTGGDVLPNFSILVKQIFDKKR
ncbi:MAG: Uma2 family endonuclease [Chloroflexota bacterium]